MNFWQWHRRWYSVILKYSFVLKRTSALISKFLSVPAVTWMVNLPGSLWETLVWRHDQDFLSQGKTDFSICLPSWGPWMSHRGPCQLAWPFSSFNSSYYGDLIFKIGVKIHMASCLPFSIVWQTWIVPIPNWNNPHYKSVLYSPPTLIFSLSQNSITS